MSSQIQKNNNNQRVQRGSAPKSHQSQSPSQERLILPFSKRRKPSIGEWVFRHRVGLLLTVVIHLTLVIMFLTYQIVIRPTQAQNMVAIDMLNENLEQQLELQQQQEMMEETMDVRIDNRKSNEDSKFDASLQDNRHSKPSQIYDEAQRVQDELAAGSDEYQKGLAEIAAMERAAKGGKKDKNKDSEQSDTKKGKDNKNETAKYSGNVTVSYYLPGRTDVSLYIPAYRCEGGGQVVVDITVNRSGRVTSASVQKSTSSNDNCIMEMAVQAARASTFNLSTSASDKQKGTITYIFVPQ